MSDSGKAVFLSYASQDAEAAKRICDALREAGVEVWFDQSELVGGDAWDAKIRGHIKTCTLFVPIISANTNARREGYFRREWKLAVDRTHDMDEALPFLVPVVIDDTTDAGAFVPERFRDVQWTRFKGGEAPAGFAARVKKLLNGNGGTSLAASSETSGEGWNDARGRAPGAPLQAKAGSGDPARQVKQRPHWLLFAATVVFAIALGGAWLVLRQSPTTTPASGPAPALAATTPLRSEARQMVERAMALSVANRADSAGLIAAADLAEKATHLDATDPEVWANAAMLDIRCWVHAADRTDQRQDMARNKIVRAKGLAPRSALVRFAEARMLAELQIFPDGGPRAETILRELRQEKPADIEPGELIGVLGLAVAKQGRGPEAAKLLEEAGRYSSGWLGAASWMYLSVNNLAGALATAREQTKADHLPGILQQITVQVARGDLDAADAAWNELTEAEHLTDAAAGANALIAYLRRDPARILTSLRAISGDYCQTTWFIGPKALFSGLAHKMAGREEAAQVQWAEALAVLDRRLATDGSNPLLLEYRVQALALLGRREEASRTFQLVQQLNSGKIYWGASEELVYLGRNEEALRQLESELREKPNPRFHTFLRYSISYDPLRGDPRFEKLLRDTLPPGAKPFDDPKPLSEARQLVEKATAIWEVWPRTSERLAAAEQLCAQAMKLDGNDGLTWAAASRVDAMMVFQRFDVTPERRQQALKRAARGMALAPEEFEARFAQAYAFSFADESPAMRTEAARIFRRLLQEKPDHRRTLIDLGTTLRELAQYDEAATLFERAGDVSSLGWNYYVAGRFEEAARVADRMLARERTAGAIQLKIQSERSRGNFEAAQAAVDLLTPDELLKEDFLVQADVMAMIRREYDRAIQLLNAYPEEFLNVNGFNGPKRQWIGRAHELAGRPAAARREWQTALRQLDDLGAKSTDVGLIVNRAVLLAYLGEKEEAESALRLAQELSLSSTNRLPVLAAQLRLGHKEEALATLEKVLGERKQGWLNLYLSVRWNPDFDMLRGDPRFDKLMRDNLPPGVKPFEEAKTQ